MRCSACGHENATEGASFCTACGKPLTSPSATAQNPAASSSTPSSVISSNPSLVPGPPAEEARAASSAWNAASVSGLPEWAAISIAVLLYLAVADAAVETFISCSPVRSWVPGVGAAYLALNLLVALRAKSVWNRFSWSEKSAATCLLLLGVMALTAWRPGGLSDGIRMLGQPTPVVFAAISGAAVAYAGYRLATLSVMPRAGRLAAIAIAAYGVAAFGLAIRSGTPYSELFHGESLWTRLPFWMQGAVVGAFLTIPLAMLAEITRNFLRVTPRRLARWL
jgi:zinc-ribbon domain